MESVEVRTEYEVGFEKTDGPMHSRAFLSKMRCVVELRGPVSDKEFEELKWVAENCPMGNTLRRGLVIEEQVLLINGRD